EIDSQYDVIVCTLNGTIGSYKLLKGQQRWQKSLSTKPIFSTPKNLQNKFLVVGITDGRVLGLSLKDGSSVWQYDIGRPIFSSPCLLKKSDQSIGLLSEHKEAVWCVYNSVLGFYGH
ncbi:hypothetical protein SSS_06245, partial [Sarcoptes scabiei]